MQVELPYCRSPHEATILKEETASSRLSFEAEIDQFHLKEEGEEPMIQVSDLEGELNRSSVVRSPKLIVAQVDNNLEEEEEMALNKRKGLKEILAERNKRSASYDTPGSQPFLALPPPLLLRQLNHSSWLT